MISAEGASLFRPMNAMLPLNLGVTPMPSLVRLPFGLEIATTELAKLILDKIFFGLIAGVVLALFGWWLNCLLKKRDRDAERATAAVNIRVAIATRAVEQVQAMGDEILAALGYLKADVLVLRQAATELAEPAPAPRPKLPPGMWLDEAWISYRSEFRSRVDAVLSTTRFASQAAIITEILR
jgi:hypothetical protein